MRLIQAPAGALGFDINATITPALAKAFKAKEYVFAVRYVRRGTYHSFDLTRAEVDTILAAGLGLMLVQHVESEDAWVASKDKGASNGAVAVSEAQKLGVPQGTMLWLDLEGVKLGTPAQDVIDYCNAWHDQVAAAGFTPGIYIGWHAILTAEQLYGKLKFQHYWSAYNNDQKVAVRSFQMRQHVAKPGDHPAGVEIDTDVISPDSLGGVPTLLVA